MPRPPLIPVEQAELDALLDQKAVQEGKQRAEIDDWLERRRADERGNEWEKLIGASVIMLLAVAVLLGIAEIGPLVALGVMRPDDGGQSGGLIAAATLISTPLVWVGAVQVLTHVWPRRYAAGLMRGLWPYSWVDGLIIAWWWAWLLVFVASRLAA